MNADARRDRPPVTSADYYALIQQRYVALRAIWTARTHTHEQQTELMAEIKGYAERYRALQLEGR